MKKGFWLVVAVGLIACSNNPETLASPPSDAQDDDEIVEEEKKIIFDSAFTDLTNLPKDEGGLQTANPMTSLLSPLGHYLYIPSGYEDNDMEYPLIVFLHGGGQRGNSFSDSSELDRVLDHGPPFLISNFQWNPKFPSIVASPQVNSTDWNSNQINGFIRYLISNFRVNETRIYLTGLSMGGRGSWFYAGEMSYKGYASAVVPICGSGNPSDADNLGEIPIWAFHGAEDSVIGAFSQNGSVPMVESINNASPTYTAKLTIYPGVGHDSWIQTYNDSGMGSESPEYDAFDMSIYDWMFQYRKEK